MLLTHLSFSASSEFDSNPANTKMPPGTPDSLTEACPLQGPTQMRRFLQGLRDVWATSSLGGFYKIRENEEGAEEGRRKRGKKK